MLELVKESYCGFLCLIVKCSFARDQCALACMRLSIVLIKQNLPPFAPCTRGTGAPSAEVTALAGQV